MKKYKDNCVKLHNNALVLRLCLMAVIETTLLHIDSR